MMIFQTSREGGSFSPTQGVAAFAPRRRFSQNAAKRGEPTRRVTRPPSDTTEGATP